MHLQIFQHGAFFPFIQAGKADHAVDLADPTVSVVMGGCRRAVALFTGAAVQRIAIGSDWFDIVDHIALLQPCGGLHLTPLGFGVSNGGFLQHFRLLLDIATNRGDKNPFAG